LRRIILQLSRSSPRSIEVPLKEAGRTFDHTYNYNAWKKHPKKGTSSSVPRRGTCPLRELSEPDNLARFHHTQLKVYHCLISSPDHSSGIEQQIISTIKTIRKKN
jgi:hypothetical protein